LVAGSSGILGSGFCEVLRARGEPVVRLDLPWDEPQSVADRVVSAWNHAQAHAGVDPISLIWAAGTGTISASEESMGRETAVLRAVTRALEQHSAPDLRNTFIFASSAGALFGGHGPELITDASEPTPITPYGREKLAQERLLLGLHEAGVMRVVACRFSNVFGLTGGRLRRKGLVAALVASALERQPARIFVSPDTRRDYLFGRDAAALALAEAAALGEDGSGTCVIRNGTTMTVLDLVASISRVLRRRVPVVFVDSPERALQPVTLRFAPRSGVQASVPTTSFEAAVRSMVEAPGI
jgi:UDP-glucose 4-epimerase